MAEEKKSVFRKEALDRISSPEEYDHYLQVTGPGVWMTLGAIVILLIGACVWAVFGRLTTTMSVPVVAENKQVVCMVPYDKINSVDEKHRTVKVADAEYTLTDAGRAPQMIDESTDVSVKIAGGITDGSFVYVLDVDGELPDGVYVGEIQIESVSPISFILN